jgi:molybdopterin molybdotransferase
MLTLEQALERLVAAAAGHVLRETEEVSSFDALHRVLAEDVRSALDVPPADNTSMDGYALRAADVPAAGTVLPVSQRIPAGVVGAPLTPGTAARIFTGAQIPPGADAVVMQEQCVAREGGMVQVDAVPQPGQWVRRRPRVAVFSTGDELAMPGEPLKPGAIYNSNRYTLRGLLQAAGCETTDFGIVPDQLEATRVALREAAMAHDLILTSGGVSVGEEDHLRPAMQAEGHLDLWRVAIKPGKPLAFGTVRRAGGGGRSGGGGASVGASGGEALFVGLPGNPVSSFVTFLLAVAPLLRALQGLAVAGPQAVPMRAHFDWPRPDRRREFLRVRRDAEGGLELYPNQSSGVLTSTVWAEGLVDNPAGQSIARGDTVNVLWLREMIGA